MSKINMIREQGDLVNLVDAICQSGWVAMDTEFLRERTYSPELCLIQVTNGESAACIDPLAIEDLTVVGELLVNPDVVKIFHSCRQDLEALDTRADIQVKNLYDTQLAAAFCGFGDQVSYAALVDSVCGVHLPKSHTRTDWSRRPLSREQLDYAMDDVNYLQALRQELDRLLEQKGRNEWHSDECDDAVDPAGYRFDPENAWSRLKGADRLDVRGQVCARDLAIWREQRAQNRNLPRGWVLPTPVLLQICREMPDSLEKLKEVDDISPGIVKHIGKEVVAIVDRSQNSDEAGAVWSLVQVLSPEQKRQVKEIMDLLKRRAQQAEISQSLIANRLAIENFVRGSTDLPLFRGWRSQVVGNEILTHYS
jgi:ribonuclease D